MAGFCIKQVRNNNFVVTESCSIHGVCYRCENVIRGHMSIASTKLADGTQFLNQSIKRSYKQESNFCPLINGS